MHFASFIPCWGHAIRRWVAYVGELCHSIGIIIRWWLLSCPNLPRRWVRTPTLLVLLSLCDLFRSQHDTNLRFVKSEKSERSETTLYVIGRHHHHMHASHQHQQCRVSQTIMSKNCVVSSKVSLAMTAILPESSVQTPPPLSLSLSLSLSLLVLFDGGS